MSLTPRMLGALADATEALANYESADEVAEDKFLDDMDGAESVIYEQKASDLYASATDTERRIVEAMLELLNNRND